MPKKVVKIDPPWRFLFKRQNLWHTRLWKIDDYLCINVADGITIQIQFDQTLLVLKAERRNQFNSVGT
jgi:hypothetical protein